MSRSPRPEVAAEAQRARALARAGWAGGLTTLEGLTDAALCLDATPDERLAMMERLALDAWASSGLPWPDYARIDMPGRVLRSRSPERAEGGDDDPGAQ